MEIVIQDEELSKEIKELKEPSRVWSKINFSTKRKHLQEVEKIINLISPDAGSSSILPEVFKGGSRVILLPCLRANWQMCMDDQTSKVLLSDWWLNGLLIKLIIDRLGTKLYIKLDIDQDVTINK